MFSVPRVNVIESDEGFSVEVLGRTGLRYTEGGRSLFVDSEVLMGPAGLVIFPDSLIAWDEPKYQELAAEEKARILENIRRAFRFRGLEIESIDRTVR